MTRKNITTPQVTAGSCYEIPHDDSQQLLPCRSGQLTISRPQIVQSLQMILRRGVGLERLLSSLLGFGRTVDRPIPGHVAVVRPGIGKPFPGFAVSREEYGLAVRTHIELEHLTRTRILDDVAAERQGTIGSLFLWIGQRTAIVGQIGDIEE